MEEKKYTSLIRLRMSAKDAHYGGNLVGGPPIGPLLGDVAPQLSIESHRAGGPVFGPNHVEFKAPVYAGDYIEAYGEVTHIGNTSRKMRFEARKVIATRPDINASAADVLEEPVIVAIAEGTCVVPKEFSRKKP